jgi:hypothetical protein
MMINMESIFHTRKNTFQRENLLVCQTESNLLAASHCPTNIASWHLPCNVAPQTPQDHAGRSLKQCPMNSNHPGSHATRDAGDPLLSVAASWSFGHKRLFVRQERLSECQAWRSERLILEPTSPREANANRLGRWYSQFASSMTR